MRKVWILVANSGQARVFKADNAKTLTELNGFVHPEIHLKDEDLVSDRPGIAVSCHHSSRFGPHTISNETSQKTKERNHFAEQIALFLEEGYKKGEFERLYVIADLPFQGFLREAFSDHLTKLVNEEIQKDLTKLSAAEIRKYLPEFL